MLQRLTSIDEQLSDASNKFQTVKGLLSETSIQEMRNQMEWCLKEFKALKNWKRDAFIGRKCFRRTTNCSFRTFSGRGCFKMSCRQNRTVDAAEGVEVAEEMVHQGTLQALGNVNKVNFLRWNAQNDPFRFNLFVLLPQIGNHFSSQTPSIYQSNGSTLHDHPV